MVDHTPIASGYPSYEACLVKAPDQPPLPPWWRPFKRRAERRRRTKEFVARFYTDGAIAAKVLAEELASTSDKATTVERTS